MWTLLEWGFPKIIPWNFGGVLVESAWLRQAADLGGAYALSFVVAFVNAAVAAAVMNRGVRLGARLRPVGVAAAVVLAVAAYGVVRVGSSPSPLPPSTALRAGSPIRERGFVEGPLSVVIVQGGIESGRSDLKAANADAWERYAALTRVATVGAQPPSGSPPVTGHGHGGRESRADLIVWPETVLRVYLRTDDAYRSHVEELVGRLGRPLLLGSLDLPEQGDGELNSAYLIEPDAESAQIYHKTYLLPFGEYVPGARCLPVLRRWKTTGRFVGGGRAKSLTLSLSQRERGFAPSICFEAIQPGWFNRMVRDGAEFLVNITDDGWFGNTAAPYQHLQLARLRAVETRRWLVRASNSGISAFIDPFGAAVAEMPVGRTGTLVRPIGRRRSSTLYMRWGDWPVLVSVLCLLAELMAMRRRSRWSRTEGACAD